MQKIYKKSKFIFFSLMVLVVSVMFNSKWGIEKSNADIPGCVPPEQMYSNGCFTPAEVTAWIASGGDAGGGGDADGGGDGSDAGGAGF